MEALIDFAELATLIRINSHTKNKQGVDTLGGVYQEIFEMLGLTTIRYKRKHIGDHLLFKSEQTGRKKLLLLGHLDTVFPVNTFSQFREDKEWIYGPGVCDMKGGNHVIIAALRQVKARKRNIVDIDVLLVSDEETGSEDSKQLTEGIAKDYCACMVFEAAGANGELVVARKGVATFTIDLIGKATHAGNHYKQGADANLAAAYMIIALTKLTDIELGTTVNAGLMRGGIGANTISPMAQITVEARFANQIERERLVVAIKQIVADMVVKGVYSKLSGGIQRDVMEPNAQQQIFLNELAHLFNAKLPTEKRGGVSDANIMSAVGVATIDGFGPYGDGDHTENERANKASFFDRISQVSRILLELNLCQIDKRIENCSEEANHFNRREDSVNTQI